MDWTIQNLGALGEFVAAIAVLITLIFLTLQMRESNRATRAATFQTVADSENRFIALALDNVEIWDRMLTQQPIEDSAERRRAILLLSSFMIDSENRYIQQLEGTMEKNRWEVRLGALPNLATSPIYRLWRASPGAQSRSSDFLDAIDALVPIDMSQGLDGADPSL